MKTSARSRAITLILAVALGGFGAHRFYVGKIGSAIAQLILTCTLIGSIITIIWVIIDVIKILTGSFQDKEGSLILTWDIETRNSAADEIQKFADLRDKGLLTEEEFQAKKKQLLNL